MTGNPPELVRDRAAQRAAVEAFVRERPAALLLDAAAPALLDVFSGKSLPLAWDRIEAVARAANRDTGAPYLVLLRDDGRQVVLADVGVAFEPVTAASGPLPGAPALACFRDLAAVAGRLEHLLLHHPDEPVTRDHLDLFRFLLALVDGARAAGFDVSPEERRLERILGEIEARRDGAAAPPGDEDDPGTGD
ncbi:MAG TPA: hypothetical protein VFM53_07785 [Anaeromyxobacteraceae bacterium]|nr:hypothetical protein [Anaeromyxobacteraceae bacterium]